MNYDLRIQVNSLAQVVAQEVQKQAQKQEAQKLQKIAENYASEQK